MCETFSGVHKSKGGNRNNAKHISPMVRPLLLHITGMLSNSSKRSILCYANKFLEIAANLIWCSKMFINYIVISSACN